MTKNVPPRSVTAGDAEQHEQRAFRDVLAQFATGVVVVTACGEEDELAGVTANSFNAVSLDPPLILWSVSLQARSCEVFQPGTPFVVNVLAENQLGEAKHFASDHPEKYADTHYTPSDHGVPILADCAATIECQVEHRYPGGDHAIIVGRVLKFSYSHARPLVFFGGRFRTLSDTWVGDDTTVLHIFNY